MVSVAGLAEIQEQLEWTVSSPTVDGEVTVECENVAGLVVAGHVHETRVREIHRNVSIFLHQLDHTCRVPSEPVRDQEIATLDIFQDGRRSVPETPKQIAAFGNHSFRRDQWHVDSRNHFGTLFVMSLGSVKQGHDAAGVK